MSRLGLTQSKVAVIGAARSGMAAARLLRRKDAQVFVSDSDEISGDKKRSLREFGIEYEERGHTPRVTESDFLVVSPGVPSSAAILQEASRLGVPIHSEIEVAMWFCVAPVVAITGSNGKTTTTFLTHHLLRTAGLSAYVAGNIGIAFSDVADEVSSKDVVVLEVSSFQLDNIDSFAPKVGVITNITPDHLNRYNDSFDEYATSKMKMRDCVASASTFIYNGDDAVLVSRIAEPRSNELAFSLEREVEKGAFVQGNEIVVRIDQLGEVVCTTGDVSLRGRHNLSNALVAVLIAKLLRAPNDAITNGLQTFAPIEHRMEPVLDHDGLIFVNDSKATNVDAVRFAAEAFNGPLVLILGGRDKGNDYAQLAHSLAGRVDRIVAIGESREKIVAAFTNIVPEVLQTESLKEGVRLAAAGKTSGTILLSPACASFDQYESYEARGQHFKQIVRDFSWAESDE